MFNLFNMTPPPQEITQFFFLEISLHISISYSLKRISPSSEKIWGIDFFAFSSIRASISKKFLFNSLAKTFPTVLFPVAIKPIRATFVFIQKKKIVKPLNFEHFFCGEQNMELLIILIFSMFMAGIFTLMAAFLTLVRLI